jgi:hypothetical protein
MLSNKLGYWDFSGYFLKKNKKRDWAKQWFVFNEKTNKVIS